MATIKALIPGITLTLVASGFLASRGIKSGALALEHASLADHGFYWSWPLFVGATIAFRVFVWMLEG